MTGSTCARSSRTYMNARREANGPGARAEVVEHLALQEQDEAPAVLPAGRPGDGLARLHFFRRSPTRRR